MSVATRGREILKRLPRPAITAEIGVWSGALSAFLLAGNPQLTLLMVDRWAPVPPDHQYARSGALTARCDAIEHEAARGQARYVTDFASRRGVMLRGESRDVAAMIQPASLDLVFLDADHSLEGTRDDIGAWLPTVRPGGWIGGHDYEHPETHIGGEGKWGVKAAVLEFFSEDRVEKGENYTWFVRIK